jgi:hypothetical protein
VKSLIGTLLLTSTLAMSSAAWSIPLSTIGGADMVIARTTLPNSGAQTEIAWIESVLGLSLDGFDYTQNNVTAQDWEAVDGNPGLFALELAGSSDWFLVKIGNNSGSPDTHFLFNNEFARNYAAVDLIAMGFSIRNIANVGKISHVAAGPNRVTVPEAGSLVLLGLGLLSLALVRRRSSR